MHNVARFHFESTSYGDGAADFPAGAFVPRIGMPDFCGPLLRSRPRPARH